MATLRRVMWCAGWFAVALGAAVLAGWALDIPMLKSPLPGQTAMKPNTAICFILLGAGLWCATPGAPALRRGTGAVGAALVAVIGSLTLIEYLAGVGLWLDRALLPAARATQATPYPGRMAPNTALALLLLASAQLILLSRRGQDGERSILASQVLSLAAGMVGLLGLFGYLYGVPTLERLLGWTGMAVHSAVGVVVVALAAFCARPAAGLMCPLTAHTVSAAFTRRMLIAALLVPPALGWVRLLGQDEGLYDTHTGLALLVTANVAVFVVISFAAGRRAARLEVSRDRTEQRALRAERDRFAAEAERDRLERQSHVSRRLESLGQLAGGVAHDFNNVLGVITGYVSLVRDEIAGPARPGDWDEVQEHVEEIAAAAERAAGLTRQLLAFARREVIKPQVLDLNAVIVDIQQLLIRTLGEHVGLVTDLDPDLCRVLADPGQVEQVLVNLAVNARDAMPGGGKLAITTANFTVDEPAVHLGNPKPGEYAAMKVSDTGTGIPPEIIDRVFEPFFSTKREGEGTGLGLATVYGIISQAGGYLKIYSESGLGTTLTALLPATSQTASQSGSHTAAPAGRKPLRGAGQTVLLVEDEDALREATRLILARNGYHVLTAADGPQALTTLCDHSGPLHLLLTDVVMPHMPGKQLAAEIRATHPDVLVLFMSGYTQGLLSSQGVLEPGIHLIEKPFGQTALLAKLTELFSGRN